VKFLVDAQLPKSLSDLLKSKSLDSIHTIELPDKNRTKDDNLYDIAFTENRIIITKDNDFLDSFLIKSKPEKLILVTTGNIKNRNLLEIFEKNLSLIIEMISRSKLVEVSRTNIYEHI
jgi:predicted nuclease of predicted toxin-antitoxin system